MRSRKRMRRFHQRGVEDASELPTLHDRFNHAVILCLIARHVKRADRLGQSWPGSPADGLFNGVFPWPNSSKANPPAVRSPLVREHFAVVPKFLEALSGVVGHADVCDPFAGAASKPNAPKGISVVRLTKWYTSLANLTVLSP